MLAKKTSKNQLTLPKSIAGRFPEIDYFDVSIKNNTIVLRPVKMSPAGRSLDEVRDKMEVLGLQEKDVRKAVRWARRNKSD